MSELLEKAISRQLGGRYHIIRTLESGGFSQTYLARDDHSPTKRYCIIKQLTYSTNDPELNKLIQTCFWREAKLLETLGEVHDQVPTLYAYFLEEEKFYLVQEYITGQTIAEILRKKERFTELEVKEFLISFLPVLDYIHSQGVIHRDINPNNIILRQRDGKPVLIDFGAVKEIAGTVIDLDGRPITKVIIGTPYFISPERVKGISVYSGDLYSLGITAICMLTGKRPKEFLEYSETLWRKHVQNIDSNLYLYSTR